MSSMKIDAIKGTFSLRTLIKIFPTFLHISSIQDEHMYTRCLKKIVLYREFRANWPTDVHAVRKCANEL